MAENNNILISIEEYNGLIIDRERLRIIIASLWSGVRLNYDETELRFDNDELSTIMKSLYATDYSKILNILKGADEENVGNDKE